MHKEILTKNQEELLPIVRQFRREYYLVGGTAIGLHIGHRRSVDFDLFKTGPIRHVKNLEKISGFGFPYQVTRRVEEQMNLTVNGVKLTFFQYPYTVPSGTDFDRIIKLPGLAELAAMKAFALGRRSKWKDYVDLFFLLRDHFSLNQISSQATELFGQLFSEKLFRAQLSYFKDIDYTEPVEFMGTPVPEEEIRDFLVTKAVEIF
ncbi:MAG: hypothetical protein A2X22_04160 [Bacteroidetes bacterium GWF2_49_14]|nr:MAG: hypothetical protein A2X22_04160 [Bacteroidetes bacterium GWF2_49_14]